MARARKPPSDAEEVLPGEAAEMEQESKARAGAPEAEVRPEELSEGSGEPVWRSPFPAELVSELSAPLDPNRVRRRQGRGGGQFEYLAGHDVKRRFNQLFGFGNWETSLREIKPIAEVEIERPGRDGGSAQRGWHVGYMAVMKVSVRTEGGDWVGYEDVGYGDGNEWGPAALVTARELAMKEAATDSLKRAATCLGDQFGLILYAKEDEKKRIARDESAQEARPLRRVDAPAIPIPQNWGEAIDRFDNLVADKGQAEAWLEEFVEEKYGTTTLSSLSAADRRAAFITFASVVIALEGEPGEIALMPGLRDRIATAFAAKSEGLALHGPPWRIGPDDPEGLPTHADVSATEERTLA